MKQKTKKQKQKPINKQINKYLSSKNVDTNLSFTINIRLIGLVWFGLVLSYIDYCK